MLTPEILRRNRVILAHFDSYSAHVVFARWDATLLLPGPLPEDAQGTVAPAERGSAQEGLAVKEAFCVQYGLNPDELTHEESFDEWQQCADGALRVHLLRFTTFEAPAQAIAAHGGVFRSISELRGSARAELMLLRQAFNLYVGGGRG